MNKKSLIILALLCASIGAHADTVDPLFSRMIGHWKGQGTRTYPLSGRVTQVVADVQSSVAPVNGVERLTSTNSITETSEGATPTQYQSIYWVQADPTQIGHYQLGYSTSPGSPAVTTSGVLSNDLVFTTDQDLGSDYNIHSETQFTSHGSTYTEITTHQSAIILKTVIQYTPSAP